MKSLFRFFCCFAVFAPLLVVLQVTQSDSLAQAAQERAQEFPSAAPLQTALYYDATKIQASNEIGDAASPSLIATALNAGATGPRPQYYQPPCPSTTKVFINSGDQYVTDPLSLGATANMNEYCHDVYHTICSGQMFFYVWSDGAWNELGTGTYQQLCFWTLQTSALTAGTHRIKAIYTDDQDGFGPSSALMWVEISKWPTTTTVTSAPNPSNYKQQVTFTATAIPNPDAPTTPTGKVKFVSGTTTLGTALLDSNGVATLTTKHLPVGTDSVTAEYLGDADNAPSLSAVLSQVVDP